MRRYLGALGVVVLSIACSRGPSTNASAAPAQPAPAQPKLGVRPAGDTEIQPDLSKIESEDLKKVRTRRRGGLFTTQCRPVFCLPPGILGAL